MPQFNGFLSLLDSASFMTIWYWVVLIGLWSVLGRSTLGVPGDVIARARRDPTGEAGLILLDWLSLCLPRWQLGPREGAVVLGLSLFAVTSLGILGFGYGLEMAQAAVLLIVPLCVLFAMRVRLARKLWPLVEAARRGDATPADTVTAALRRIVLHRRLFTVLSILSVTITAMWGTLWGLMHPNGL
ncbi:hypothetical protein MLD63_15150 [Paracoccus sp. TK19116]|uniref:Component of SufBCD complex n=1 Tax=Paracoccus albicereus TaxID=2922394 RepID=A0ABT1MTV9_9RHOB|nr:hypothetical protein [Paracoccus albicereus]MCQ0971760.1 hypothetical protein [Paracoccus albicereus]